MIAFCGLTCTECPAFIATRRNDDNLRQETAELWSKIYKSNIAREAINCNGCLSDTGRVFGHCQVCEIRKCGTERRVENCAHCPEFGCGKLAGLFQAVPEAKRTLEKIRSKL